MNNIFLWFKITGDIENIEKANFSAAVHNFLFDVLEAKKIHKGSNAFLIQTDLNVSQITNQVVALANKNLKLFIIDVDTSDLQGLLTKEEWKKINRE